MEVHKQVDELIKEYAAVDAVAVDIISDKHQVCVQIYMPMPISLLFSLCLVFFVFSVTSPKS